MARKSVKPASSKLWTGRVQVKWAGSSSSDGYRVRLLCPCGAVFSRWVTPEIAEHDLLRSGLPAFEN